VLDHNRRTCSCGSRTVAGALKSRAQAVSGSSMPGRAISRAVAADMSKSVMRGLRDEKGSWKISCISLRSGLSAKRGACATSTTALALVRKRISPLRRDREGSQSEIEEESSGETRLSTAA